MDVSLQMEHGEGPCANELWCPESVTGTKTLQGSAGEAAQERLIQQLHLNHVFLASGTERHLQLALIS